jgi:hypothetical protein
MDKSPWSDRPLRTGIIAAVIVGWLVEFSYAAAALDDWASIVTAFCVLWFASGASFFVGAIAGFIFGVPRMVRIDPRQSDNDTSYTDNTSLEDISDWLTKIVVGLGLVQFQEFVSALNSLGSHVGSAISSGRAAEVIGLSSVLYGFVSAFIFFYLWTRIYLPEVLASRRARLKNAP